MYRIINKKKKATTMAADFIGGLICQVTGLKKTPLPMDPDRIRRILIIRTAYVGDVMMTVPMLKPLKTRFKNAHITFLTASSAQDVLIGNPYVDAVETYNPFWFYSGKLTEYLSFIRKFKKKRFDLIIEARGDIRDLLLLTAPIKADYKVSYDVGGGGFILTDTVPHPRINHRVHYHLDIAEYLGALCDYSKIEWKVYLTDREKQQVADTLSTIGVSQGFWCAHPGSRVELKQWSINKYTQTFDMISNYIGLPLVLLGGPKDGPVVQEIQSKMTTSSIQLTGKTSLREMAGILEKARLFFCNDSAPMHIAAAMDTPIVALFGPSKPDQTGPYTDRAVVVKKDIPCRERCDENRCGRTRRQECMTSLMPKDVLAAVKQLKKNHE